MATAAKPRNTYKMLAKGSVGEIYLYGPIGQSMWMDGITATQFAQDLKALGSVTQLDVRVNSEGGDVFDGRTIYSLLMDHKATKRIFIDGLAASAASLIAMAGKDRIMADGSFMMIHNASGVVFGDANEMRRMSSLLDSISASFADTYAVRTGYDRSKIVNMMNEETWLNAEQAKTFGFSTQTAEPVKVAACISKPEMYRRLPTQLRPNRAAAMRAIAAMAK